jgi:uncharacterized protein YukE
MFPKEMTASLDANTHKLADVLAPIAAELATIAKEANEAGTAAGNTGLSTCILAEEYRNFAARIDSATQDARNGFDSPEKVWLGMQMLDDIHFQMNLLCFFSETETARIGGDTTVFVKIDRRLNALLYKMSDTHQNALRILHGMANLIHAQMEKDINALYDAVETLLLKTASDGIVLAGDVKAAALAMGEYGGAYRNIADTIKKAAAKIKENVKNIHGDFNAKPIGDAAFVMNVCAFNAAIETARAGNPEPLCICAEGIRNYAGQLHEADKTCTGYLSKVNELFNLINKFRTPQSHTPDEIFE